MTRAATIRSRIERLQGFLRDCNAEISYAIQTEQPDWEISMQKRRYTLVMAKRRAEDELQREVRADEPAVVPAEGRAA